MYKIYPNVKLQNDFKNEGKLVSVELSKFTVYFSKKMENVFLELKGFLDFELGDEKNSNFKFLYNKDLGKEAYTLDINDEGIIIRASANNGFYYGMKTFKQIYKATVKNVFQHIHIEDEPDLKVRGYMCDISRNKVPKLETLKYIVDIMSELKMNHFELYVEGFSFEYKSFKEYLTKNAYVTLSEYKKLEKYCMDHCIDFVPNQNGFGHMGEWLALDEFNDLAEKPEGFTIWESFRKPTTLAANDPRSVELVTKMYADMLPHTKSKYFNMNFDEPFEIGLGKTKEEVLQSSVEDVYKGFVRKVHPVIESYGKQALMWGDVLVRKNASLDNLPESIIYVDWGYDGPYKFEKGSKMLHDAKVPFMNAPGTCTWCSWLGRLYDWIDNIGSAVRNAIKYGGEGVLLTDWGDFGHIQQLVVSLPPLAYSAMLCYRNESGVLKNVREFLNKFVFNDRQNLFANVVMDAGSFYQFEKNYRGNGTITFATFYYIYCAFQKDNPIEAYEYLMRNSLYDKEHYVILNDFLKMKKKQVNMCNVDDIWKNELNHSVDFVMALSHLNYAFNANCENKVFYLEKAKKELDKNKKALKKVWLRRNKISRLDRTNDYYDMMIKFINLCLNDVRGGTHETKDQNN